MCVNQSVDSNRILNLFRDAVLSRRPLFFDDRSSKNGGKRQRLNELYQVSTI